MNSVKRTLTLLTFLFCWLGASVYGGLEGWWLSPIAKTGDRDGFIQAISHRIHALSQGNTAWVMIEQGKVTHEDYCAAVDQINRDTRFPLASLSKLFTAYGVMQLVEAGKIKLSDAIEPYLTRWQLPKNEFTAQPVTWLNLLSHTGGLTDHLGFGDYLPEESIPTIEQSLAQPRAHKGTATIAVSTMPGSQWQYSGGGYLLLELLVEELTQDTFENWMQKSTFEPLNMTQTTYQYLGNLDNHSGSYDLLGQPAPIYRYAAIGATGLNSTPADLTKFVQALIQSNASVEQFDPIKQLRQPIAQKWGADIWGAGAMLYAPSDHHGYVYGHDGLNDPAINTTLRINPANGDAIIVLSTGRDRLAYEIGYEWTLWQTGYPDFLSTDKALKSTVLPGLLGYLIIVLVYFFWWMRQRNPSRY